MRLLILLVIVGVCLVSAKYLPDETNNFKQLLSRHKRSDSEDSLDESSSNDTDDVSDEELREQSKLHARIEKMRQKLIEKQEKERRRQEEAQQKLEERIARELQKEEERRQKEEERRQQELRKEEERRQKELQKEEERRQKEEEKRQKDLQKHEEKLEKERRKLEEQQKKLREKAFENERKRQEMLQKQLEEMEEETRKLEGDVNSSDSDADESTDLEDFWKSYIYSKYGLNESNTELEKRIALRRYMQEELGLNVNSTESERRQAILRLIEHKWQTISEQYVLQSQMIDFVNKVGVEKIRAQLEKEIEEINNKTNVLNNVNLPWVPLARDNFAEQVSFLQTIKEFLASILPNWYNENISSTTTSTLNDATEIISSMPSENQNQNILESSLASSDISSKGLSNINDSNNINTSAIPILSDNSGSNVAVDSSSSILDKNVTPAIVSGNYANESSSIKGTDSTSSIGTDVDTNKSVVSSTAVNNYDIVSTTKTESATKNASDFANVVSTPKNEMDSNGFSSDGMNLIVGTNYGIIPPDSQSTSTNLIINKDASSSVISRDAPLPALASLASVTSDVNNFDIVSITVTESAPNSASSFSDAFSNSKNEVDSNSFSTNEMNSVTGTNSKDIIPAISEPTSSTLISKDTSSFTMSGDAPISALATGASGVNFDNKQDSDNLVNRNVIPIANQDSISKTSDTINGAAPTNDLVAVSDMTSSGKTTTTQVDEGSILPSLGNAAIKTDVNNNSPSTDGLDNSLNEISNKINGPSIDEDASVTIVPTNELSILVTKIMSSVITTEASEVVSPIALDLEKKLNSDISQSAPNNAPVANNNQMDVSNTLLPNDSSNGGNILPFTTESNGLNIITSIGGETSIRNNVEDNISTASNIASSTDEAIYSSVSSTNDNNPIITLSPGLLVERQDSVSSIINDSANTRKSDITADHITTVITESSNKIIMPNAESAKPAVDVAVNNKNEENISSISTDPINNVIESNTDNILSSSITPFDASGNTEKTISIQETTTKPPEAARNSSIDNLHLERVDVISKIDDQYITKTLYVSESQNSNEPLTTITYIDLEDVSSTVSDGTIENDAIFSTTVIPSAVVTENVNVASRGPNVSADSDIIISKNSSTNSGVTVSVTETTELPVSVTDNTVMDQSTSVVSDAQQLENDNVTENQYIEKDIMLLDTGIPIVIENGSIDSIKNQVNPIDNITVPDEPGALVIAVVPQ